MGADSPNDHLAGPARLLAERPKLVHIVTSALSVDVLLHGQLRALAAAGFAVTVITSPDPGLERIAQREGVSIVPVRMEREMNPLKDWLSLVRLYRALREIRPEIVTASTPKASLLGMVAAGIAGVPFRVYQQWGMRLETTSGWKRRVLLATEWITSRVAHQVVCNSFSLRDAFLRLGLAPASKVTVLGAGSGNGVDTERFYPPSSTDTETRYLRQALGFDTDDVVIGFVGRLTRDKGICDLLVAFDEIARAVTGARLLLVGDFETGDPLPAEIIERIARDDRIVATGFVNDTAPYYRTMNLLAFPSYREGFPHAPLEAAASALPVVGYRATGTVDAVVDGETGILVEVGDSMALAQALGGLLEDPALAQEMAAAARKRAVRLYDSRKVWQCWADFYWERLVERVPAFR